MGLVFGRLCQDIIYFTHPPFLHPRPWFHTSLGRGQGYHALWSYLHPSALTHLTSPLPPSSLPPNNSLFLVVTFRVHMLGTVRDICPFESGWLLSTRCPFRFWPLRIQPLQKPPWPLCPLGGSRVSEGSEQASWPVENERPRKARLAVAKKGLQFLLHRKQPVWPWPRSELLRGLDYLK